RSRSRRTPGRRARRVAGRAGSRRGCRRTCGRRGSGGARRRARRSPGARLAAWRRPSRSARRRGGSRLLRRRSCREVSTIVGRSARPRVARRALLTVRVVDGLQSITADPGGTALFFDVDGVLAPIVERPEDARVPTPTRRALEALRDRYALVACVTGRPSEVARGIVGVEGLTYVGEHGLELDPDARDWAERIHGFAVEAPWSDIEVKPLSVAFHYRTAP